MKETKIKECWSSSTRVTRLMLVSRVGLRHRVGEQGGGTREVSLISSRTSLLLYVVVFAK